MQQVQHKQIPIRRRSEILGSLTPSTVFATPQDWTSIAADWVDGKQALLAQRQDESPLLESPHCILEGGQTYYFFLSANFENVGGICFSVSTNFRNMSSRAIYGLGRKLCALSLNVPVSGRYHLSVSAFQKGEAVRVKLSDLSLQVYSSRTAPEGTQSVTGLPHWSVGKKLIHTLCRNSRLFNSVVAAVEIHAGSEELLSLPQYMALCPTGQCNASCGFCSVTTNRSGIIKKQIPFDKINSFFLPIIRTAQMFGIEGNGEPTLYDHFSDLVVSLTAGGTPIYLITNGERLTEHQIALLLAAQTNSINFSLNAATAETHKRVMKLKSFDAVVENIRCLVDWRGESQLPLISVSFVVTHHNIKEVSEFLRFAEWGLRVDRIFVRPLSEIANDEGTVEDLRDLVPFQSDIDDMLDAAADYLLTVPRRADIHLNPEAFKAYRPDPAREGAFLVPHQKRWQIDTPGTEIEWRDNAVHITSSAPPGPYLFRSYSVSCKPETSVVLNPQITVKTGKLGLGILNEQATAWIAQFAFEVGAHDLDLPFWTMESKGVQVCFYSIGPGDLDATVDWRKSIDPVPAFSKRKIMLDRLVLPEASRWLRKTPEDTLTWLDANRLSINWAGAPDQCLLRSGSIPCIHMGNAVQSIPVKITVTQGSFEIRIVSVPSGFIVRTESFDSGTHNATIRIDTCDQDFLSVEIISQAACLTAEIDFLDGLKLRPFTLEASADMATENLAAALMRPPSMEDNVRLPGNVSHAHRKQGMASRIGTIYNRSGWRGVLVKIAKRVSHQTPLWILDKALRSFGMRIQNMMLKIVGAAVRARFGSPKIYCQKPWTDLNNFTVDGRMDVCCITTGESQKRYALGNIFDDDFQKIWNGEQMKEFRRTVNGKNKLPPCERCPMANNYRSPF